MIGDECAIEDVLESRQLRHRLRLRPPQNFIRRSLRHDPPGIQRNDILAQRKHLLALMRDIENRNLMLADSRRAGRRGSAPSLPHPARSAAHRAARREDASPSVRASAARCRSPPEIIPGRRPASAAMRNASNSRAATRFALRSLAAHPVRTAHSVRPSCAETGPGFAEDIPPLADSAEHPSAPKNRTANPLPP